MWNIIKKILIGIGTLLGIVIVISLFYLVRGGAFKTIESHYAGECNSFPLDGSAEDITIDHERGLAYLSQLDRMTKAKGGIAEPGMVMKLDLSNMELSPALITTTDHMSPHGLSLYISPEGQRSLFMINHPADRVNGIETINRYNETAPGEFSLTATLSHPDLISPNDLVAIGPNQVYVANDKGAETAFQKFLENIFGLGYSKLVYFDGNQGKSVLSDVASGGGINASADGSLIYIAETGGKAMRVLRRNNDGSLTDLVRVPLGTSPDNIDVGVDGSLTIAAHANIIALIQHFISDKIAPSQVLRLTGSPEDGYEAEEIYLNTGEEISVSSVGATYGNKLLIGSITSRQVLICERSS